MGEGWYHCRSCRRKFTIRVGTMFGRSHIPLHKWLLAQELINSAHRHGQQPTASWLHKQLGITYRSARLLVVRWNLYVPNAGPLWWVTP
jgi:transposase-like protein